MIFTTSNKELGHKEFERLSEFIFRNTGIKMPITKKTMLQARLQNRLKAKNMNSFSEYVDYIFSPNAEEEIVKMIDVVSTNKTDFFREPKHFEFLKSTVLPNFHNRRLKIWSAASSSGEEIYSLAITIEEYMRVNEQIDYSILGTDISTRILEKAANATYAEERIADVPMELKKRYFLKSRNREIPLVKPVPAIRSKATFSYLNLMDDHYKGIPTGFDIIFCRNVLIYFERDTQEKVINKLCEHLVPGGYFMLGHSESVTGLNVPLKQVLPTIFTRL